MKRLVLLVPLAVAGLALAACTSAPQASLAHRHTTSSPATTETTTAQAEPAKDANGAVIAKVGERHGITNGSGDSVVSFVMTAMKAISPSECHTTPGNSVNLDSGGHLIRMSFTAQTKNTSGSPTGYSGTYSDMAKSIFQPSSIIITDADGTGEPPSQSSFGMPAIACSDHNTPAFLSNAHYTWDMVVETHATKGTITFTFAGQPYWSYEFSA